MRLLQPGKHGGYEATPRDFAEAVMAVAKYDGSAGWVCGVVGVHPWELAQMDPRLQEEIWGENQDTWVASPYIPGGIAEPTEGGYVLRGRWPFSSGTDHADWCVLGAMVGDGTGSGKPAKPPTVLHVVLPRADYQIIPGSWDTIGLQGTGSKDVVVDGAFIPEYRTINQLNVMGGEAATHFGVTEPLYQLPFTSMFPLGITSAVVGICEGALAAHLAIQRDRVAITGAVQRDDPYALYAAGEAASEIQASRTQLIDGITGAPRAALGRRGTLHRGTGGRAAQPDPLRLAGRHRGGPAAPALRRQRDPARQPVAASLAGRARRAPALDPRARRHLPRQFAGGHGRRRPGHDERDDLARRRRPVGITVSDRPTRFSDSVRGVHGILNRSRSP
jgi:alkylation response protein AidB-like acyl-CoA dehydrogenase